MNIPLTNEIINYIERLNSHYNNLIYCIVFCDKNNIDCNDYMNEAIQYRISLNFVLKELSKHVDKIGYITINFDEQRLEVSEIDK